MTRETRSTRSGMRTGMLLVLFAFSTAGLCTPIDHSVSIPGAAEKFGRLDQKDLMTCVSSQPGADPSGEGCGPAATVNSFAFLEKEYPKVYGGKLIIRQDQDLNNDGKTDDYDDLIATGTHLAGLMNTQPDGPDKGTHIYDFVQGKEDYLESLDLEGDTIVEAQVHPDKTIADDDKLQRPEAVVRTVPTWQFLKENIKEREDVEVLVNRVDLGPNGEVEKIDIDFGHYITVFALRWVDQNMDDIIDDTENAMWDYIDPRGGRLLEGRKIFQNLPGGPILAIGPTTGHTFAVTAIVKESPLDKSTAPEPETLGTMLLGIGLMLAGRARGRTRSR